MIPDHVVEQVAKAICKVCSTTPCAGARTPRQANWFNVARVAIEAYQQAAPSPWPKTIRPSRQIFP